MDTTGNTTHTEHHQTEQMPAPLPVTLAQAFVYWLKLGFISFGGPAGQIAIMHHDLVEKKRWISERRFLHALNYCMVLPGPEAQQLATYIGWLMHRTWGGIIAGGLFVLPSFFILLALAWIYMAYGGVPAVAGVLYGIKPAVVAIVLFACYRIGARTLKNPLLWTISVLAFLAIFVLRLPFPAIVLAAGLAGYFGGRISPRHFKAGGGHGASKKDFGPALIDDDTPVPGHAVFSWPRLVRIIVIGIVIWLAAMAALFARYGWDSAFTQMGWFFTKAALLTFGGAYAVLPYVYQGAVEHYQWLTPIQMIDGLALGETTPGPLIMVITFVGFVGGWSQQVFDPDAHSLPLSSLRQSPLFLLSCPASFSSSWAGHLSKRRTAISSSPHPSPPLLRPWWVSSPASPCSLPATYCGRAASAIPLMGFPLRSRSVRHSQYSA